MFTWTMNKRESVMLAVARRKAPSIHSDLSNRYIPLALISVLLKASPINDFPLYNVTINAPAIDTIVPITFAWLI